MTRREAKPYDATKRVMDAVAAAVGLAVTAPIQVVVAAFVLTKLGRPVFFRQDRPGLNGEIFELVKFRSMRVADETRQSDAERLTKFGRLLRASSLDELPTLWNVLKGDMSLVGPRPLLVQYLGHYTPEQARRHEVRPGVTGLAQVAGRNGVSWNQRLKLDVEYVGRYSLAVDASILLRTLYVVITGRGVNESGHATMSKFTGEARIFHDIP